MVEAPAAETVVLGTGRALVVGEAFLRLKGSRTPSRRTPSRLLALLHELVKTKLLKLLFESWLSILVDVGNVKGASTAFHGTNYVCLSALYFGLEVASDALGMENMTAL